MSDFAAARRMMVDGQIRTSAVTDLRLIAAMLDIPRERFVPPEQVPLAYLDLDLPVGDGAHGRRLLKPMVQAKLIQAAEIAETDHVLDVGCATGYSSAILARLAASVIGLEQDRGLARQAGEHLRSLPNVTIVAGTLAAGHPAAAPYDVILVNGSGETVPQALLRQLKDGGRLIGVIGRGPGKATVYRRDGEMFGGRPVFDAAAPALPGFAKAPAFAF